MKHKNKTCVNFADIIAVQSVKQRKLQFIYGRSLKKFMNRGQNNPKYA
jgi:hypothetical protein